MYGDGSLTALMRELFTNHFFLSVRLIETQPFLYNLPPHWSAVCSLCSYTHPAPPSRYRLIPTNASIHSNPYSYTPSSLPIYNYPPSPLIPPVHGPSFSYFFFRTLALLIIYQVFPCFYYFMLIIPHIFLLEKFSCGSLSCLFLFLLLSFIGTLDSSCLSPIHHFQCFTL